jgi:hypothetical protein
MWLASKLNDNQDKMAGDFSGHFAFKACLFCQIFGTLEIQGPSSD